jgi:hypothetical protein
MEEHILTGRIAGLVIFRLTEFGVRGAVRNVVGIDDGIVSGW